MALKYQSIGLPSTHVVDILSVMDEAASVLRIKVTYPSYVVRDGDGWQPDYEIYNEPIIRSLPKLCWKSNLILLEAEKMVRDDKVDALLVPRLVTDRFRPCVGANGLITLLKRQFPDTPVLSPEFYDEEEATHRSMEGLMRELGGAEADIENILKKSRRAMAFEKTIQRDAGKFIFSHILPTIGVISHFRELV